jgi:RimJ/RimL family protein N-acetyltransferase
MFVLPEYRNNGYATEACGALIKNAFSGNLVELKETAWVGIKKKQNVNIELIEIEFSADNIAAQKVVEKLGFTFNGIEKRGWRIDSLEQYTDLMFYSLEKGTL